MNLVNISVTTELEKNWTLYHELSCRAVAYSGMYKNVNIFRLICINTKLRKKET